MAQEEELRHGGRPLSSLDDAELRASRVGDDDEDLPDTVDDIIQQGRMRKEEAAREREELEQQRKDLDTWWDFLDWAWHKDSSIDSRSESQNENRSRLIPSNPFYLPID